MSFFVYRRRGNAERDLPASRFPLLLDELGERLDAACFPGAGDEPASVSAIHESEWSLGLHRGGYVTFEHGEGEREPRHMCKLPRDRQLTLMAAIVR